MSMFSLVFVVTAGLVAAGIVASAYAAASGEPLQVEVLGHRDWLMPLRALALVVALPIVLGDLALRMRRDDDRRRFDGWLAMAGAGCWCFVQGVVIVAAVLRLAHGPG